MLEQRDLIERAPDPNDRRGTLVKLTSKDRELVDEVVVTHLILEDELLAGLSASERGELSGLLATWARALSL